MDANEKVLQKIGRLVATASALIETRNLFDGKPPPEQFSADEAHTIRKGLGRTLGNEAIRQRKGPKLKK